jgi:hypothetical protein
LAVEVGTVGMGMGMEMEAATRPARAYLFYFLLTCFLTAWLLATVTISAGNK